MNSKNSEAPDRHKLLFNLTDKITLKRSDKYFALSNFSIYYTWKNIKNLNYLIDHILYQTFKIILNISKKNMERRLIILQ